MSNLNLVGQKFGRGTVLEIDRVDKNYNKYWKLICECGNYYSSQTGSLRSGNCKSCGCLQKHAAKLVNWKGYEEIPYSYYRDLQNKAVKRNIEFLISIEDIWNIFILQNKKCKLSGRELFFTKGKKRGNASVDRTDINVILDRSNSMGWGDMYNATIIGFNRFLSQQKEVKESARINFYQFDDIYETVYTDKDIMVAPELNRENFVPRGNTALLDAVGKTIDSVGSRLRNMKESERPQQVMVIVITDGEENCSRQYTKSKVEEMIKHQTDVYKWQFVYIGANLDAVKSGRQYASYGSNFIDEIQLTSGKILVTPGEYMVNAFNKLGKSAQKLRCSNNARVDNLISLDATDNQTSAKEARELLGKK